MMTEKIDSREKILIAAKAEFAEKGFSGARMGAISKSAGVNQALLHYYFESKEKLYHELLHRMFGVNKAPLMKEHLHNWNLTPPEGLYVAIYLLVHMHFDASDPDFNRIIAREIAEGRNSFKSIISDFIIPKLNSLEQLIIDGVEGGFFETRSTFLTVMHIVLFVISFQTGRENYSGTEIYDKMYGLNTKNDLFLYLVEQTFKGLAPAGRTLDIPQVPAGVIKSIDEAIEKIKNQYYSLDN